MTTRLKWNTREVAATVLVTGAAVLFTLTVCNQLSQPAASAEPEKVGLSESTPAPLPACESEDSENCIWDAAEQGNGEGTSFVDIDGTPYYPEAVEAVPPPPAVDVSVPACTDAIADAGGICKGEPVAGAPRPADGERATGPVDGFDEGVLFCGVSAAPAEDIDPYGNHWAYCEPALVGE